MDTCDCRVNGGEEIVLCKEYLFRHFDNGDRIILTMYIGSDEEVEEWSREDILDWRR